MDEQFNSLMRESLVWLPERGMGYYPVTEAPYDADYFAKYQGYAETELGRQITSSRVAIVYKYIGTGVLLDVGIGCGHFIEARGGHTFGFDVNPTGVAWLKEQSLFLDPADSPVLANVSLWDVLEHLPTPHDLLAKVHGYVFTSLPIFRDCAHVLSSKHYRRDEHRWYWTDAGLRQWFDGYGFECVEALTTESDLGREDIGTYVFKRK